MEYEDRELAGAARTAHVLHITPRMGGDAVRLVEAALGKTAGADALATLMVVPDRQTAYELTALPRTSGVELTPLTVASRATRLLQRQPRAVVGTPADLLALVRSASLKLETVREVVIVWADVMLADERQGADLDTLLAETPKDSDRTLIVEEPTPAVENFVERVALKPRRLTHAATHPENARSIGYIVVAAEQRAAMLQRLLDAHDSSDVLVIADEARAAAEAGATLHALGMRTPDDARVAAGSDEGSAKLVVWYGVPASLAAATTLAEGAAEGSELVALITASELARLRAAAVTLTPVSLPQATDDAVQRQRALQEELSTLLRRESVDAELASLEPLLAQHDAAEVAAAALRLLGRARKRAEAAAPQPAAVASRAAAPAGEPQWTRLFLSVGERDGARRGDLVGAITGEAEITGAQVGKIEMRDSYSLVDVAAPVADRVVERLTGVSIRGRRVTARLDRSGTGGGPAGARSGRPDARRGAPRREHYERSERGSREGPRAARESEEWAARGERLRHARRPPPGGDEA